MFIIEELKQLWVIGFNLKPAASSVGIHEKKKKNIKPNQQIKTQMNLLSCCRRISCSPVSNI